MDAEAEHRDDNEQHELRADQQREHEHDGKHEADSDGRRQVAPVGLRRSCRRSCGRAGAGRSPAARRLAGPALAGYRARAVVGRVGADGDAAGLAAQRNGIVAVGDVVDLVGNGSIGIDPLDLVGLVVRIDGLVVAPDRRLSGERRPDVEVIVGSDGADVVSVRGISPVGGSVQCGNGPVSDAPNDRPVGVVVVVGRSANNGGP